MVYNVNYDAMKVCKCKLADVSDSNRRSGYDPEANYDPDDFDYPYEALGFGISEFGYRFS